MGSYGCFPPLAWEDECGLGIVGSTRVSAPRLRVHRAGNWKKEDDREVFKHHFYLCSEPLQSFIQPTTQLPSRQCTKTSMWPITFTSLRLNLVHICNACSKFSIPGREGLGPDEPVGGISMILLTLFHQTSLTALCLRKRISQRWPPSV